jgi:hypothetical protein
MAWARTRKNNNETFASGMTLARALVFLRGIDLLSCVYCAA